MAWNVGELRRGGWLGNVLPEPAAPPDGSVILGDVVVSETAPTDTTAAWANPTEEA